MFLPNCGRNLFECALELGFAPLFGPPLAGRPHLFFALFALAAPMGELRLGIQQLKIKASGREFGLFPAH